MDDGGFRRLCSATRGAADPCAQFLRLIRVARIAPIGREDLAASRQNALPATMRTLA